MDYTQLKSEVADFSHRTDLTNKMDIFAELAEAIINRDLRVTEQETILPVTFTDTFYDLPTDYLEMRAMHIEVGGRRSAIDQVTPQVLDYRYSRATGFPRAFAIHGGQIEFRPGIEATDPVEGSLTYFAKVPAISSNGTTTILDNYPLLYLAAMLIQVYLYLQDDVEMQKWAAAYNTQLVAANKAATKGRYVNPSIQLS